MAHATVFFIYGAVVHVLLFRAAVRHAYRGGTAPQFLGGVAAHLVVALVGGASVATLFLHLLVKRKSAGRVRVWATLPLAALYGAAATVLVITGTSVLGGALVTRLAIAQPPGHVPKRMPPAALLAPLGFFFLAMEIGFYAFWAVTRSTVCFALLYGALGGLYALVMPPELIPDAAPEGWLSHPGNKSLLLGLLGALFLPIPPVGLVISAFAVFYGLRSEARRRDAAGPKFSRWVGAVVGTLCIAFWLYPFAMSEVAGHGWLKPR
ncbi:MAG TPA: hypothetical protein VGS20_14335 [Candidatus Acidoferrales bacterium]|nr:hypothetical protein [Candidatus Acidoferrales bacterium]